MSIRSRIFGVIGGVVAAAFMQTFVVIYMEGQRAEALTDLDGTLLQYEYHTQLGRLVTGLENRACCSLQRLLPGIIRPR